MTPVRSMTHVLRVGEFELERRSPGLWWRWPHSFVEYLAHHNILAAHTTRLNDYHPNTLEALSALREGLTKCGYPVPTTVEFLTHDIPTDPVST